MTQAEYSRHRGVSRKQVTYYKNQGYLTGAFRRRNGKIWIVSAVADRLLNQRLDPAYTKSSKLGDKKLSEKSHQFLEAKTWEARFKAASRKLEFEIKTGKYLLKSFVRDGNFRAGRIFRDSLLNIGPRVAPILASESSEEKILELLQKEFNQILKDFIRNLNKVTSK